MIRGLAGAGRWVALLVIVALAASGCAGFRGGNVAYVGDQVITEQQLDEAVAGVKQTLEEGQQVSTDAVVNVMIHGAIANQIAAAKGIAVTDAQRNKVLATSNLAPLLEVPAARTVAYDAATQQIVAQTLGPKAYLEAVGAMPVTLNPRFGVLNTTEKTIIDGLSSSLSQPA